jgi:flagellar basal-body rod protein FlgG
MRAQQWRLDATGNNLANVDVTGYKKDITTLKSFPAMLLRRCDDDGVYNIPPGQQPAGAVQGSADVAPIIGELGTGVELNELYTDFEQGAAKETDSDFDVMLDGKGFLAVETPAGERYTRDGAFQLGKEGFLETKEGYPVLGEHGRLHVKANNFKIDKEGHVWVNAEYADEPTVLVSRENNTWEKTALLDTLKIVDFDRPRYLKKQGVDLYATNEVAGAPQTLDANARPRVIQGFIEASNVNPVTEMINMIEVNRAYEANQRVIHTADSLLGTLINQYSRVS